MQTDSDLHKYDIELTQKWIYEDGTVINGTAMKHLLGVKSQTPTWVCHFFLLSFNGKWAN
jgi:hypothetical protein